MANEEQLSILKQGVEVWNKWRKEDKFATHVDLTEADLREAFLFEANLSDADLRRANLRKAVLRQVNFREAFLSRANLRRSDLRRADLVEADLHSADLVEADLSEANLRGADLSESELRRADLSGANLDGAILSGADISEAFLSRANLKGADLKGSNFLKAVVGRSIFASSDLSDVIGLEDVVHRSPSILSTEAFIRSKGKIPEAFLRGCGLSDWEIEEVKLYQPGLSNEEINKILYRIYDLRATQALQISPLFISYSHGDGTFVDKLEGQLNKKGIRFWRDIHDMKAGRMETQIDRAINQNRTVLLVLSEHSISSDWVEHEVRTARGLEKELGRDTLCPVALDDSWKDSKWEKRTMEQVMKYNILDFSAWKDNVKFEGMFRKLIDGLELFYKG